MAVYAVMFMGMTPLGSLGAGWIAKRIGVPTTVGIGGAVCVLAGLGFGLRLPSLRAGARELIRGAAAASNELAQAGEGDPTAR
ncbi:hypothetical protein [Polyangium jinanense]|uniref:MFS transporter n=1 Tax=Polyangium jinanense TaxID=2829994 RepID=A0A9X3XBF2_9BACT|nr:hypothetical protein [Polyangium jinanense]MDC3985903.1 hypothetical protein [Polyangium jinanense]MDC3988521.1 hypothetical protein [Polyangium jinanense]